jgi:hypothetical protein
MSDTSNTRMLDMYMEEAEAPMFFSGFFRSPPRNFHNTEKVELDIIRDDEDIAIVVQDLTVGARHNESTLYTNKAFTPPIFKEQGAIHAFNMIKRRAGVDPFQDPNFGAAAGEEAFTIFRKLERKIRRSVELMCAQVLQTGVVTLIDDAGVTLYSLDYQPKTSHITTTSTTWATDGTSGDPLSDLSNLGDVVRQDGKHEPTDLIFGKSAWQRFIANTKVLALLDNRRMEIGKVAPVSRGQGASFRGTIWIDHYEYNLWMYNGFYKHPQTGAVTAYMDSEKVVMLSKTGRLDLSYGAIPRIVGPESRALPFLPPRMSSSEQGLDLTVNSWFTPDGEHLFVSAGTRPLAIPTAIDTFACLDVTT